MRRNLFRTFFATAILAIFFSVPAYAESAVITGHGVNLRAGPGTNYFVLDTLPKGTRVEILDRSGGSWVSVAYAGGTGFVSASYLQSSLSSAPAAPVFTAPPVTSNNSSGYINAMYVRFRSGPSSSYSILGVYSTGKPVTVIGSGNGWTSCIIDGQMGYVYSQYISSGSGNSTALSQPQTGSSTGNGVTVLPPSSYYPGSGSTFLPQPMPDSGVTVLPGIGSSSGSGVTPLPPQPMLTPVPTATPAPVTTPFLPITTPAPVTTPYLPTPTPTLDTGYSANIPAYIVGSYVRVRSGPGTNYSIIGTFSTGKAITVRSNVGNGWLACTIDGAIGYIHGNYVLLQQQSSAPGLGNSTGQLQQPVATPTPTATPSAGTVTGNRPAYIVGNNVRFRAEPNMNSRILCELFYGNIVTLHATQNSWALISYNGQTGYVYAKYVKIGSYGDALGGTAAVSTPSPSATATPSVPQSGVTGQQVANYAMQLLGSKYCWGGANPSTGFDCSGFVYYVYRQFGYTLSRVSQEQASNGVPVAPAAIQPGDIVCFYSGSNGYIGHSGIYIGENKFIHSSNPSTGVIISELSGHYNTRGYVVRRIIN